MKVSPHENFPPQNFPSRKFSPTKVSPHENFPSRKFPLTKFSPTKVSPHESFPSSQEGPTLEHRSGGSYLDKKTLTSFWNCSMQRTAYLCLSKVPTSRDPFHKFVSLRMAKQRTTVVKLLMTQRQCCTFCMPFGTIDRMPVPPVYIFTG